MTTIPKRNMLGGMCQARVYNVYDGDTMDVVCRIDGARFFRHKLRIFGCDTPELKGPTKDAGMKAKAEALRFIGAGSAVGKKNGREIDTWFRENPTLIIIEFMSVSIGEIDKYGRDLARVFIGEKSLSDHLIATGNAVAYSGGTKNQSQWE